MNNGYEMFNPKDSVNVTVFMNLINYAEDEKLTMVGLSYVSIGAHYLEASSSEEFVSNVQNLVDIIKANLTERCDTELCNGFCDARDRCTCPMCCENDCYYTYCDTTSGTCTKWPHANPKMKIDCPAKDPCGNTQECFDGLGCIITKYADECKNISKCLVPVCDYTTKECSYNDICPRDTVPTFVDTDSGNVGMCYNHYCGENGECIKEENAYGSLCNRAPKTCEEAICSENGCEIRPKKCVKTAPYTDMTCYEAVCESDVCINKLTCQKYSLCAPASEIENNPDLSNLCYCNATTDYQCKCSTIPNKYKEKTCDKSSSDKTKWKYCDYTKEEPECYDGCDSDLHSRDCKIEYCDKATRTVKERDYPCDDKLSEVDEKCRKYVEAVCEGNNVCVLRTKNGSSTGKFKNDDCTYCILENDAVTIKDFECLVERVSLVLV